MFIQFTEYGRILTACVGSLRGLKPSRRKRCISFVLPVAASPITMIFILCAESVFNIDIIFVGKVYGNYLSGIDNLYTNYFSQLDLIKIHPGRLDY